MSQVKQEFSRRELLKAMTALGGAVASSSLLPGKWAKPEIGAGALPAHAQGTQDLVIDTLTLSRPSGPDSLSPETLVWEASFNYKDPLGKVDYNSQLYAEIDSVCTDTVYDWWTLTQIDNYHDANITGDGFTGTISFHFDTTCDGPGNTLHVTLKVGTRVSGTIDEQFPSAP